MTQAQPMRLNSGTQDSRTEALSSSLDRVVERRKYTWSVSEAAGKLPAIAPRAEPRDTESNTEVSRHCSTLVQLSLLSCPFRHVFVFLSLQSPSKDGLRRDRKGGEQKSH